MAIIVPRQPKLPKAVVNPKILYLGQSANEICDLVSPHIGSMSIDYTNRVNDALALARAQIFDLIIVDQRDVNLASKLILPLFSALGYPFKLIVITVLSDVGSYLRVPGVARVLTAPLRANQLSRALGLDPTKMRHDRIKLEEEKKKETEVVVAAPKKNILTLISNLGMQIVSTAYKRLAFVLLGVLFLSFTFYGFMIGFFLTSSGWAAPQTLTQGNVLVDRVQKELGDMRLALNLNIQRISESEQQMLEAERAQNDATIMVNYATDTVAKEIVSRTRQLGVIKANIKRTQKVKKVFDNQIGESGLGKDLAALYGKRLIDRKTFTSNTLGLLESGQRISGLEVELEIMVSEKEQLQTQVEMLRSLKAQLQQKGPIGSISAASADLLLLTKQSLDARAVFETAKAQYEVSSRTRETLLNSKAVLQQQIATIEKSTLGRAFTNRVDVLFVPYSNATQFKPGMDLHTCKFTFVYCWKAGVIGQVLPGEINSVHPFFGKPIRGFFVEAKLDDTLAATREIIHAQRPPLFF